MPNSLVETGLMNSEDSIMATFDFLSAESVVDDDNEEENDEPAGEDDKEEQIVIKKPKLKVCHASLIFELFDVMARNELIHQAINFSK